MRRRTYLARTGGTDASSVGSGDDAGRDDDHSGDTGDPEAAIRGLFRRFVERVDALDREGVYALAAAGAPFGWTPGEVEALEEYNVEMTGWELLAQDDDEATAELTLRLTSGDESTTTTHTYELRRQDGGWLFWEGVDE